MSSKVTKAMTDNAANQVIYKCAYELCKRPDSCTSEQLHWVQSKCKYYCEKCLSDFHCYSRIVEGDYKGTLQWSWEWEATEEVGPSLDYVLTQQEIAKQRAAFMDQIGVR